MGKKIIITEEQYKTFINEWYSPKQQIPHYSYNDKLELINDPNIKDGGNFGIKRNGKEYWVSRSNTISLYVFCKDESGEWNILCSQRGPKSKFPGKWNVVCGFLDYGESLEECAVKECWEETGVKIKTEWLNYLGTNSLRKRDAVNTAYYVILNGNINDYPTSIKNCEPGEVTTACWLSISNINKLSWSGKQGIHASEIIKQVTNETFATETIKKLYTDKQITLAQYQKILKILKYENE